MALPKGTQAFILGFGSFRCHPVVVALPPALSPLLDGLPANPQLLGPLMGRVPGGQRQQEAGPPYPSLRRGGAAHHPCPPPPLASTEGEGARRRPGDRHRRRANRQQPIHHLLGPGQYPLYHVPAQLQE